MLSDRRRFLRLAGSAATLAVLPACTPMPEEALEAWRRAGEGEDPRLRLLSWAILAPNPHNQ